MRYDNRPEIDAQYAEIAFLYDVREAPERAMALADQLVTDGEDRSWASVWWAYGAVHYDLRDEAYDRALELLARVDRSEEARAAALMLTAEIESTSATDHGRSPDPVRQVELLGAAIAIAPDWPSLRLRVAYPLRELGEIERAHQEAQKALDLIDCADVAEDDPYEHAITGRQISRAYAAQEVAKFRLDP